MSQKSEKKSEKQTYTTLVRMTDSEHKKYEKLAAAKGLSLAGLVRLALSEYSSKKGVVQAPENDVAGIIAELEARVATRLDAIQDRLENIPATTQVNIPAMQAVVEKVEILKTFETLQIVQLLPNLSRDTITDILVELNTLGKIKTDGKKWVIA